MKIQYVKGRNVLIDEHLKPATIQIDENGKITKIYKEYEPAELSSVSAAQVFDAGDRVVMPGLVDTHTHIDEPGRTDWEGFWTATRSAAAGGITTVVDMPLQCNPPTTTVENLKLKLDCAKDKCHTDLKFWGGAIGNPSDMKELLKAGVAGFKCFLIDTSFPEFPHLDEQGLDEAVAALKGTGSVLQIHAEIDSGKEAPSEDTEHYQTVLKWHPASMEVEAIKLVSKIMKKHKDVRCHIVHLSATEALPIIRDLKQNGYPLTVETCPHYLHFADTDIGTGWTEYLCLPPIRDADNREKLWEAIREGLVDSIAADHANCTPCNKPREFTQSWGGIAGLSFGLPVVWTNARTRGYEVRDIWRLMSKNTAKLAGLDDRKGDIKVGYDADFVVWDAYQKWKIEGKDIHYKNKLTPYHAMEFYGKVTQTILRGNVIYDNGIFTKPQGEFIFHDWKLG